jgi:hypothetical protein
MGLMSRSSREERFWRWFQDNSERLFAFESDQDRLFNELQDALGKVEKGLTFEFGPIEDGRREFVISADGIRELFPAVQRLADAAPRFSQWTIIPFRPPRSLDVEITLGRRTLGPGDLWFTDDADCDRIGLTIFVRGLTEKNHRSLAHAGFLLLDNALGEYVVETEVGFVEWEPLPEHPETSGMKPFHMIRESFGIGEG